MPLTSLSDFFANVNEEGINLISRHIMRQRPSLFNRGSAYFVQHPGSLCEPINPHPEVVRRGNPVVGLEPLLPLPGTDGQFGIEFFFQLVDFRIDLHPGNVIQLPVELNPPLDKQHFAGVIRVCGGIGCPGSKRLPEPDIPRGRKQETSGIPKREPIGLPVAKVDCFCLELFAVGHIERQNVSGQESFVPKLDGLEIVDLRPQGMEDAIECYMATAIRVGILPRLRFAIETLAIEFMGFHLGLSTVSQQIPFNPSVADDSLSVFLDLKNN